MGQKGKSESGKGKTDDHSPSAFPCSCFAVVPSAAAVFAIIFGAFGFIFTTMPLAVSPDGFAGILPQAINVIASVLAAIAGKGRRTRAGHRS
jgi:hypothetical protein